MSDNEAMISTKQSSIKVFDGTDSAMWEEWLEIIEMKIYNIGGIAHHLWQHKCSDNDVVDIRWDEEETLDHENSLEIAKEYYMNKIEKMSTKQSKNFGTPQNMIRRMSEDRRALYQSVTI